MSEVKTPVRTFQVEYKCDHGCDVEVKSAGEMLASLQAQYIHQCPCCSQLRTLAFNYPKLAVSSFDGWNSIIK